MIRLKGYVKVAKFCHLTQRTSHMKPLCGHLASTRSWKS
jgi:hypothetical protein